jgi:hypothetical protein
VSVWSELCRSCVVKSGLSCVDVVWAVSIKQLLQLVQERAAYTVAHVDGAKDWNGAWAEGPGS